MTAPKWITPVGPILKKVASATGNATNTTLHLDSTSNIKNGLIVGGPGVNPDTKIVKFQQRQRTLPINSIRTDTANSSLAIITYPVQQYAALSAGGTASISGVFTDANATERTVSSNAYNGTYNVTVSGLASSTLYLPGIPNTTAPVTAVKPTSTVVTGISNNAFVLKDIGKIAVGQYIEFNNAGYTSTTTSYGMTIDYIPMGNVVYGQAYRVQSVNRDTKSITVSDGTNVYPPIQPDLYDVAIAYTTGDRCVYREKTYRALSSSTAIIPDTDANIWQDITPNTNRYPPVPQMGVYAHDYRLLTASVTTTVNSVTVSKPVYSNRTQRYDFFESVFIEGDIVNIELVATADTGITYIIHNGQLPTGTTLVAGAGKAFIKGTLGKVSKLTPYTFTVRASTTVGGVIRYSDRSFTISVIGKGAPTFVTKPGAIGNQHKLDSVNTGPAAPAITNIVVETGGNTFVSILPYNLLSYGINNNTAIYISGVSSMTELNGQIWYAGNVNQSTSKIQLFNGTGSNEYYQTTKTPGSYSPSGTVTTVPVDSVYFESQLEATLPIHANTLSFSIVGGTLPAGLEMNSDGYISGYPLPPLNMYGEPTQKDYRLKIKAETETGSAVGDFVIPLYNQEYLWNITSPGEAFPGRQPVMLNNAPKNQTLDGTDTYFSYYFTGNNIGSSFEATNFQWKMIGYDWNKEDNQYNNESLIFNAYGITDGDVVDQPFESINTPRNGVAKDGWITGRLNTLTGSNANITLKTYPFTTTISVPSADGDSIIFSDKQELSLTITDSLAPRVTWVSPADLGTVIAGHASRLSVVAKFTDNITDGTYRLESGKLPPHLELLSNGDIVGKIVYQPASELLASGDTVYYHFTVSAYSKKYESDGVIATRKFTVGVNIDTDTPYDDLYVSAFLPTTERYQIKELLNKIKSAHTADVYRPQDEYHGIAKDLRYGHAYGVASRNAERFYTTYSQVIKKNHYFKNLVLGNLTTAVARDSLNNIIYEVVYAPILDSKVNPGGVSIAKQITWPNTIRVDGKPVSSVLYPNSLTNMRLELEKYVGEVNEKSRLPLWMTSQQRNGSDTGYVPAWVLCYTLPGKSEEVVATLNTHLTEKGLTMNAFSFSMDRFLVDRTMSYTWGTTELNQWPTIRAQFKQDQATYGNNIVVDSLVGLEINQPIQFTSGANIANVRTDNTYYITEINPKFKVAGVGTLQTIKIRSDYYGTSASVITPGEDGNMSITMMPFSSFSSDNAYDTYVIFEQETILK